MMEGPDSNASGPVGPELIGRLLEQHTAALELYARQFCHSPEDVVQEALVELAGQPRAPRDLVAWLYRVVRNKAISAARSAQRRKRHEMRAAERKRPWFIAASGDVLDAEAVTAALENLSVEQREVVVAHLWGGLTFQQVGQLTNCSDSAAQRRYLAAVSALRERLMKPCLKNA
jgi:RNA polymerase sigma-70 factor (ECF subfamily)